METVRRAQRIVKYTLDMWAEPQYKDAESFTLPSPLVYINMRSVLDLRSME